MWIPCFLRSFIACARKRTCCRRAQTGDQQQQPTTTTTAATTLCNRCFATLYNKTPSLSGSVSPCGWCVISSYVFISESQKGTWGASNTCLDPVAFICFLSIQVSQELRRFLQRIYYTVFILLPIFRLSYCFFRPSDHFGFSSSRSASLEQCKASSTLLEGVWLADLAEPQGSI